MASRKRYKTEEEYQAELAKDRIRNQRWRKKPSTQKKLKRYRKNYYQKNKDAISKRHRNSKLKWAYGISQEEWDKLFESQGSCCAICKNKSPKEELTGVRRNPWHTDHDHTIVPVKVRGILCNSCNKALGLFKDDPDILREATNYLERKY